MKVVHIESGLGNQMLSYCEYLALKMLHPEEDIRIETIVYDISECNKVINQWNGYELERVFGIKAPNIREVFTADQWRIVMDEIRASEFWIHNWNYPPAFTAAFAKAGLKLLNIRGDFDPENKIITGQDQKRTISRKLRFNRLTYGLRRFADRVFEKEYLSKFDRRDVLFYEPENDVFTGQWLYFKLRGNGRERIDDRIRKVFIFPPFADERNMEMAEFLEGCNSVAIHARRGDMLGGIWWCYQYGYFKRAVQHIKKSVKSPVFVFFTDPGSIGWCRENAGIFGLDFRKDKVCFVDWNSGNESFRDMQLMSHCKHAIITNSSFGWWGAYFIQGKDKITISPSLEIDTTFHC